MEGKSLDWKLSQIKSEIGALERDADNPFHKARYLSLSSIYAAVNPLLAKYGVWLGYGNISCCNRTNTVLAGQPLAPVQVNENWYSIQVVISDGNEQKTFTIEVPESRSTDKANPIQTFGATMTYAVRYLHNMLFAIEVEDNDPDGALKVSNEALAEFFEKILPKAIDYNKADLSKVYYQISQFVGGRFPLSKFKEIYKVQ